MGLKERDMFYSKEIKIEMIQYRINLLKSRNEMANIKLIAALEREKKNLEKNI